MYICIMYCLYYVYLYYVLSVLYISVLCIVYGALSRLLFKIQSMVQGDKGEGRCWYCLHLQQVSCSNEQACDTRPSQFQSTHWL